MNVNRVAHLLQAIQKDVFDAAILVFQFCIGGPLSGSPLHSRNQALNFLLYGRKLWHLLPPGKDVYSNLHPIEFANNGGVTSKNYPYYSDYIKAIEMKNKDKKDLVGPLGPCQITQTSGSILYIPNSWTSSSLNMGESVGFALEIV